jgi:MoxR-like ATPase
MLLRAAKAHAIIRGREHVVPDDVQALCEPVLAHRLLLGPDATRADASAIVADAVASVRAR